MPDDPLQRLLANPDRRTILTRIDDKAFGQYPAYFRTRIKALAQAYAEGRITLDEWLAAMEAEVDDLHHAAYMTGSGKGNQLDGRDLAIIAAIVAAQLLFLRNWANQLRAMTEVNPSALISRANLYLYAANSTIQKAETAALGMPELPAYPGDGQSQCLVRCLCHWAIQFLPGDGNWDCYWVLGEPETVHCDNCPRRAEVWKPLQIRSGVILPYSEDGLFADH